MWWAVCGYFVWFEDDLMKVTTVDACVHSTVHWCGNQRLQIHQYAVSVLQMSCRDFMYCRKSSSRQQTLKESLSIYILVQTDLTIFVVIYILYINTNYLVCFCWYPQSGSYVTQTWFLDILNFSGKYQTCAALCGVTKIGPPIWIIPFDTNCLRECDKDGVHARDLFEHEYFM